MYTNEQAGAWGKESWTGAKFHQMEVEGCVLCCIVVHALTVHLLQRVNQRTFQS